MICEPFLTETLYSRVLDIKLTATNAVVVLSRQLDATIPIGKSNVHSTYLPNAIISQGGFIIIDYTDTNGYMTMLGPIAGFNRR